MRTYSTMFSGCSHYLPSIMTKVCNQNCIFPSFYFPLLKTIVGKRLLPQNRYEWHLSTGIYALSLTYVLKDLDVTTTTKGLTQRLYLLQTHPGSWAVLSVREIVTVTPRMWLQTAVCSFTLRSSLLIHWWRYRCCHSVWNCWAGLLYGSQSGASLFLPTEGSYRHSDRPAFHLGFCPLCHGVGFS